MFPAKTRRAARISAAAVGGVLAAGLAASGAQAAQPIQNYKMGSANGAFVYSTNELAGNVYTVFGANAPVRVNDGLTDVHGAVSAWSSDGNRVLVVKDDRHSFVDVNPWTASLVETVVDPQNRNIQRPSISPNGLKYAYGTTTDGYQVGNPYDGFTAGSDYQSAGTAWSKTDRLIWVNDEADAGEINDDPGVYAVDGASNVPATSQHYAVADDEFPLNVSISADGTKLAYDAYDNDSGSDDIRVSSAENGSEWRALEPGGSPNSQERFPVVSPDGTKVAFVSDRVDMDDHAKQAIYTANWDGTNVQIVAGTTRDKTVGYTGLAWQPAQVPDLTYDEITSAPEPGSTLKVDVIAGQELGSAPLTTTYNWQECATTSAASCSDTGVTTEGFPLTSANLGKRYRVVRTVSNPAGSDTLASEITDPVEQPDNVPPGVPTIDTKPAAKSNTLSPTFAWTGAEGGGTYQCSIDNAAFTGCTSGATFNVVGEGPHSFRVKQLDAMLNASDPAEYAWTVDTTPPSTPNVTTKPAAKTKSTTATIAFTGDEAGGKFECRVGKDPWADCTSPLELSGLTDGDKSYSIRQVDAAGNVSADPALVEWTVDTEQPLAPTFGTNDPAVYTTSHARAFIGEADGTYECQLDDSAWEACTTPKTLSGYTSGPHTFRVRQTDDAGNTGPAGEDTFTAYVDGPAAPSLLNKPAEFTKSSTASFSWHDNGGVLTASFECRLDGGAWEACVSGKELTGLTEAKHTFEVRAIGTNAVAGTPAKHEWTVDVTKPSKPVLTGLPPAKTTTTGLNVDLTVEPGAVLKCRIDGNTNANGAWAYCGADLLKFPSFPLGKHTFEILQVDKAGNESEPASFEWEVVEKVDEPQTPSQPETPAKPETPATPQTPATQAPAVETPAPKPAVETPKATTTAPKTETVAPTAKPKLTALIGGNGNGTGTTGGTGSGTNAGATITVKQDGVGVGCSITGTVLTSCTVDLYAAAPATGATARAAAAKQVLVGTGTYRKADGSKKLEVDVTLNATGRALMRKSPNGLKVSVKITGTPVKGEKLEATGVATLVRQRVSATVGGFAVNSAKLTGSAKRQLDKLAKQVRGTAVAIRVVGHTDGSTTDADYLKGLGKRRAQTVAAYLRAHGVKAKATLVSRGSTQPRATNSTKAGRAKNRRVELRIDR